MLMVTGFIIIYDLINKDMLKRKKSESSTQDGRAKRTFAAFGRSIHKIATPFIRIYLRDKHVRVRTIIINDHKEVLLVRSWFSRQDWSLPGGGIGVAETPAEAAAREVFEETGIRIALDDLHEVGTFKNPNPKAPYTVACYKVDIPKRPPKIARRRQIEMLDVGWFDLNKLPKDRSELVDLALGLIKL